MVGMLLNMQGTPFTRPRLLESVLQWLVFAFIIVIFDAVSGDLARAATGASQFNILSFCCLI